MEAVAPACYLIGGTEVQSIWGRWRGGSREEGGGGPISLPVRGAGQLGGG